MAAEVEEGRTGIPSLLSSALIGWTPLIEMKNIPKKEGIQTRLIGKMETYQPLFSVKDRTALSMIEDAEEKGLITPGVTTLIEPTSGNLGIGLVLVAIQKGYRFIAVMPARYSPDKQMLLRFLGAELILTDPAGGYKGAMDKVEDLMKIMPNYHCFNQATNPANPEAHFKWTGPEIWKDTAGKVDFFVTAAGTGGTLSGVGRYLKIKNPSINIVCVEPSESAVISGGSPGSHKIQGTGPGFIPKTLDRSIIDEVVTVSSEESMAMARRLAKEEGLLVGISSGANVAACIKIADREENKGKMIVTMFPSGGERYMNSDLFAPLVETMAMAAAAVEVEEGRTGIPSLLRLSAVGEEAIASNVAQLIGWTPLIEMKNIAKKEGIQARLVGKMEAYQPLFSVKDRTALGMVEDAEEKGLITPGVTTLIEPTGGNLGTGLVLVAIQRGYRFIAVMPAGYSLDKQMLLRFLGAEVILTDPAGGFKGMMDKVEELTKVMPNYHCFNQSINPANPDAHFKWTGPEIWKDTAGKVDIFVTAAGTGGTLSGVGRYLKMKNPSINIVCVEPSESAVISGSSIKHGFPQQTEIASEGRGPNLQACILPHLKSSSPSSVPPTAWALPVRKSSGSRRESRRWEHGGSDGRADRRLAPLLPTSAPALSSLAVLGGSPGFHKIQGTGPGFIPENLDRSIIDEVVTVSSEESITMARRLAKEEGLLVGISSGANVSACIKIAAREENKGKMIVTMLPSGGERYMNSDLFADVREECANMTF
uniref:Tryptophan synthase beta chain-like PALP domain-containing protein n=1 Tax=Oryza rufipogon TaxID=4529 RepID=A0A0E0PZ83_ORYRU